MCATCHLNSNRMQHFFLIQHDRDHELSSYYQNQVFSEILTINRNVYLRQQWFTHLQNWLLLHQQVHTFQQSHARTAPLPVAIKLTQMNRHSSDYPQKPCSTLSNIQSCEIRQKQQSLLKHIRQAMFCTISILNFNMNTSKIHCYFSVYPQLISPRKILEPVKSFFLISINSDHNC